MVGRIPVMDVMPVVDLGRQPAKATVGEPFPVSARVFREGHDKLGAEVVLTGPDGVRRAPVRMTKDGEVPDRYGAWVTPDAPGSWTFEIQAWSDPVATWQHAAGLKIPAGVDVDLMFLEGRLLLDRVHATLDPASGDAHVVQGAIEAATDVGRPSEARLAVLEDPGLAAVLLRHPLRELTTIEGPYPAYADRRLALFGSWYEFFPRSEGATQDEDGKVVTGTLRTAAKRLDAVAEMGFDVIYLPPIHPIGEVNRKGPNNTLTPGPRGPRLPVGDRLQGRRARRGPSGPGHARGLRRVRRARQRPRSRGGARPRAAGGPRPPLGDQQPAVLHHPRRRDHRLRGEPAQEVPGHLPDQLRQRPGRHLSRGPAGRQALDGPRRADLPRRQPAHQAGRVLGVAAQGDPTHRPGRAVPVRGLHPSADDARPRRGRVPPVLHVLHLAHRQVGARGLPPRGVARVRPH